MTWKASDAGKGTDAVTAQIRDLMRNDSRRPLVPSRAIVSESSRALRQARIQSVPAGASRRKAVGGIAWDGDRSVRPQSGDRDVA